MPAATVMALGALTLTATPAHAATTSVPCDPAALVQAVNAANASIFVPDTLSLAPNCVYTLTTVADTRWNAGLPVIDDKLTINGNHATISRAQNAPQFRIISNWSDLTLNEITITGGHALDGVGTDSSGEGNPGEDGGAIENWGPLTITDSVITGNTAGAGAPGADGARPGRGGLGGWGGGISSYGSPPMAVTITDSLITGNATGAGGRGGNGTGTTAGAKGASGGFGGGVEVLRGTVLRLTGSTVTGNITADGGKGGWGGPGGGGAGDGGSGGTGAGVHVSTEQGELLYPTITDTTITGNRTGRGGDSGVAGPGGSLGRAGFGGRGGGLSVSRDTLTLDGGTISDNDAGGPGAGSAPVPASGGGINTLSGHVTLTNGAVVSGNRPNNCTKIEDVPGCVNDQPTAAVTVMARQADDRAIAEKTAAKAISVK